jgi:predicted aldo/keto reductase-like oxidoreductase
MVMERKKWSTTGIETSHLGFGCMRLPMNSDGEIDEPQAFSVVRQIKSTTISHFILSRIA